MINAGTCGGFKNKGSRIGDVYISDKIRYFDRRISIDSGYQAYGEGAYYPSHAETIAQALGLKMATVCTGSSFDMSPTDEEILRQEPLIAKEMEAAAIASVAKIYDVPLLAVKSVTDLMDEDTATTAQFLANLRKASELLQKTVFNLLELLSVQPAVYRSK